MCLYSSSVYKYDIKWHNSRLCVSGLIYRVNTSNIQQISHDDSYHLFLIYFGAPFFVETSGGINGPSAFNASCTQSARPLHSPMLSCGGKGIDSGQ